MTAMSRPVCWLPPFELRVAHARDTASLVHTWVSSQRRIYPNEYDRRFPETCGAIARATLGAHPCMVAHVEDAPDDLLGWMAYSYFRDAFFVVHYAFSHPDARRQGLQRRLLGACNPLDLPVLFRHATASEAAMRHFAGRFIFDPHAGEVVPSC